MIRTFLLFIPLLLLIEMSSAQNQFHDFIKDYESLLNQYVDPSLDVEERILFKQEITSMFKDEGQTVVYNDLRVTGQEYIPISEYLGNLLVDYPSGVSIELKNVQDEFDYDTNRAVISFESYYDNDRKATLYCLVDVVLFSKEKFRGKVIFLSHDTISISQHISNIQIGMVDESISTKTHIFDLEEISIPLDYKNMALREVNPCNFYDRIYEDKDQIFIVSVNNKIGVINKYGSIIIPPKYHGIYISSKLNEIQARLNEGLYRYNYSGDLKENKELTYGGFSANHLSVPREGNHIAVVQGRKKRTKYSISDLDGNILLPFEKNQFSYGMQDNRTVFNQNGKDVWVIDGNGDIIIEKGKYESMSNFSHGLAKATTFDGDKHLIDSFGVVILEFGSEYSFDGDLSYMHGSRLRIHNEHIRFYSDEKVGVINLDGEIVIERKNDGNIDGRIIGNFFYHDLTDEFINMKTKEIIKNEWDFLSVTNIFNGFMKVKKNGKYGFIDINSLKEVIPTIFDKVDDRILVAALVKLENKEFYLNEKGKCVRNCPEDSFLRKYKIEKH